MDLCFSGIGKKLLTDKPFWVIAFKKKHWGGPSYKTEVWSTEREARSEYRRMERNKHTYVHVKLIHIHDNINELIEEFKV